MLRCPYCFGEVKVERVDVEVEGGVRRSVIEGRCTVCGAQVKVSRRLALPSTYSFRRAERYLRTKEDSVF